MGLFSPNGLMARGVMAMADVGCGAVVWLWHFVVCDLTQCDVWWWW
jgi:hypothetical protein